MVLASAVLVATSPGWLEAVAATVFGPDSFQQSLPFSPYWVTAPSAALIAWSWIYEMGQSAEEQSHSPLCEQVDSPSESAKAGEQGGSAAPPNTSAWRRLESDFRDAIEFGADLNARWERISKVGSDTVEKWTIETAFEDQQVKGKFEALASTAGRMLVDWPGYTPSLSPDTLRHTDPAERWYCALRDCAINTETFAPGEVVGGNDAVVGHSHSGLIRGAIRASLKYCVQLALEEEGRPDETPGSSLGARLVLPDSR